MKYRLIRFSNGEVVLDKQCIAPNQFGCNRRFGEEPGNTAVLIEYRQSGNTHYYTLNGAKGEGAPTWVDIGEATTLERYKYVAMLKLNGAL